MEDQKLSAITGDHSLMQSHMVRITILQQAVSLARTPRSISGCLLSSHRAVARCTRLLRQSNSANSQGFDTLALPASLQLEVKKSKFLATAWPVDTSDAALEAIREHSDKDASHNCWAYKLGDDFRSADDGEPSGTAGRPILGAIEGEGLDHVCVMVTRHFGGVKLGAGGLTRAYGHVARECLRHGERVQREPLADMILQMPYESMGTVYSLLDQHQVQRLREHYLDDGTLQVDLRLKVAVIEPLQSDLLNATSGAVKL